MSNLIYNKILTSFELICPLFKQNLITKAFIVGSVAKGTAREDSDIDIYLINPLFEYNEVSKWDIQLSPEQWKNDIYTIRIVEHLKSLGVKFEKVYFEKKRTAFQEFWYQYYKNQYFHIMYDYESESITNITNTKDEYIEITKDFCDIVKLK